MTGAPACTEFEGAHPAVIDIQTTAQPTGNFQLEVCT
jgi:hypothetical protein